MFTVSRHWCSFVAMRLIYSAKRHNITTIQHRRHIEHVTNIQDSILTCDVNAQPTRYSHRAIIDGGLRLTTKKQRQLIHDIISNSEHKILKIPTRVPHTTVQQTMSPDITTIFTTLYNCFLLHSTTNKYTHGKHTI